MRNQAYQPFVESHERCYGFSSHYHSTKLPATNNSIMAEIAGLVLGTLPLVIWALEKYAEPFEFYNKYRITIETQRDNLVMQNLQLRATLAEIGLSDESTKEELVQCFQAKYPETCAHLLSIIQRMDNTIAELMRDLKIDIDAEVWPLRPKPPEDEKMNVKHRIDNFSALLCQIKLGGNGVELNEAVLWQNTEDG